MKIVILIAILGLGACSAMDKLKVLKAKNLTLKDPETYARGAIVYKKHCLRCHGPTGTGDGPDGKTLHPSPTNLKQLAIEKSANSTASNVIYGKGKGMPKFDKILSRTEVWDVSNYVKNFAK